MDLIKFKSYATAFDGELEFAALEADGFHAAFSNYAKSTKENLMLPVQGGVTILLPKLEIETAYEFLDELESSPVEDFEPIKSKKRLWAGPILLISLLLTFFFIGGFKAVALFLGFFGIVPILAWLHAKNLTKDRIPK